MNKPFKWESFDHFYNTVRKRTREKIGSNAEPIELRSICDSLFRLSGEIDTGKYKDPTGLFIHEIKQTRDLTNYAIVIRNYQRSLTENYIDNFKKTLLILERKEKIESDSGPELISINELSPPLQGPLRAIRSFDGLLPEKPGVYFLFDRDKQLLYIGKSICLPNRVPASFYERRAVFVKIMITETKADAHILEPYCISMYAPPLNGEFNTGDKPTFRLDIPSLSDFIEPNIVGEYETNY